MATINNCFRKQQFLAQKLLTQGRVEIMSDISEWVLRENKTARYIIYYNKNQSGWVSLYKIPEFSNPPPPTIIIQCVCTGTAVRAHR